MDPRTASNRHTRFLGTAVLTLALAVGAGGCDDSAAAEAGRPGAGQTSQAVVEHLDAQRFAALAKEKNGILLDVRTPGEVAAAHVAGASVIDIGDPQFRRKVGLMQKDRPVFVYCASGSRSRSAVNQMKGLGFTQLYNLKGGLMAWKRAGLPLERGSVTGAKKASLQPTAFDAEVQSSPLVLVSFQTEWCAPCRKLAPIVDDVAAGFGGKLKLLRVDVDASEALAAREKVEGVPVLALYQDGKQSWRHQGEISREALEAKLRELSEPTADAVPAAASPATAATATASAAAAP